MSHKLKTIEPDALLCRIEGALDKLTYKINNLGQQERPKPRVYRELLARRIHLTQMSFQMRSDYNINFN